MAEADPRRPVIGLNRRVNRLSAQLVRMHAHAASGHLGGDLSCLPALVAVSDRLTATDHLVLSKGHSAAALYVALAEVGLLPSEELASYYTNGTRLPGHPPVNTFESIPFGTGSLGHGLSLAAGLALGARLKGEEGTVYCVTSDGEWEEGSTWEAFIFANHHHLANLVILVDLNGWQALGRTRDIASMDGLPDRMAGFPAAVHRLDGDDAEVIAKALAQPRDSLTVFVLDTTKGRGLGALADTLASHYAVLKGDHVEEIATKMESV